MKKGQTVLIVDGGGRGAALVDAYAKSKWVKRIIAVPGNDLMYFNTSKELLTFPKLETTSVKEIITICKKYHVDFADVAQENAVEKAVTDEIEKLGIPVAGPTKAAGQIEWDKAWARDFMKKYQIPHPQFYIFTSEQEGIKFLKKAKDQAWFVKAYGLAYGKGALPAYNNTEAIVRIKELQKFGKEGETYLLEDWLIGEEFSTFALCDGKDVVIVGSAQDHKRTFNFDQGENTGGIGSSTPPLVVNSVIQKQAENIIRKTVQGLAKEGRPYKGILYLGGIVVKGKVFIIEFNARWGDPEAEVMIPSIKNDFFEVSSAVAQGNLKQIKVQLDGKARVVVTGSLSPFQKEKKDWYVFGLEEVRKLPGIKIYGTRIKKKGKNFIAGSGRLFHVMAEGRNVIEARRKVYEAMGMLYIEGNNLHYRTDIGWRDVERLSKK